MDRTFYYNIDYVIRETSMPCEKLNALCVIDEDGRANIYLNSARTDEEKIRAIKHELIHYEHADHYRDRDIAEAETKMHEKISCLEIGTGNYLKLKDAI